MESARISPFTLMLLPVLFREVRPNVPIGALAHVPLICTPRLGTHGGDQLEVGSRQPANTMWGSARIGIRYERPEIKARAKRALEMAGAPRALEMAGASLVPAGQDVLVQELQQLIHRDLPQVVLILPA